jgi:hypothetical protein
LILDPKTPAFRYSRDCGKGQAGGGSLMLPVKEADNKDVDEKAEKKESEG